MTTSRFSALLAAALLAGCGAPQPTNETRAATPIPVATTVAAVGVRSLPEAEQRARAFKAVFGKAEPVEGQFGFATKAAKLIWQGDRAVLITVTASEGACHACSGSLGIYYLAGAGDAFRVTGKFPEAVPGNGYGGAPSKWSVSDKFGPVPVIYSEAGWTGQGYTCTSFTLTELAEKPTKVATVPIFYDDRDTGSDDVKGMIEGKLRDISHDALTIHYAGAATFDETWRRGRGVYRMTGKSRMLTC